MVGIVKLLSLQIMWIIMSSKTECDEIPVNETAYQMLYSTDIRVRSSSLL